MVEQTPNDGGLWNIDVPTAHCVNWILVQFSYKVRSCSCAAAGGCVTDCGTGVVGGVVGRVVVLASSIHDSASSAKTVRISSTCDSNRSNRVALQTMAAVLLLVTF